MIGVGVVVSVGCVTSVVVSFPDVSNGNFSLSFEPLSI